jgi:CheY-like chemotaxis protein
MDREYRILVVDDDAEFCCATSEVLTGAGFTVRHTQSTHQALNIIDAGEWFDLLLLDVRMPPGQPHGFALARLIRGRRPQIKIIYITGYPELATNEPAAALGAVLSKPTDGSTLVAEVRRALVI